jgi:guanyl-specific ribonuclease Sa
VSARLHTIAFMLLCVVGAVAAVGLTVREIARTTPIALRVADTTRSGESTLVTVSVRNTTGATHCVVVRVAARDRAGHDLAAAVAARTLDLPAHARRMVRARLTLTPRQYAEDLHAFYPSERPCRQ